MSDIHAYSTTDGSNNSAAPNGFPEGQAPSTLNDCGRAVQGALARWYQDQNGTLNSTGSSSAYILAGNQTYAALSDIGLIVFKANHASTGATTINIDGLGVKSVLKNHDVELAANDIETGQIVVLSYNATDDVFELVSSVANVVEGFDGFITEKAAADADVAGDGQLWVDDAVPNVLMFTNDAGTDEQISGLGYQSVVQVVNTTNATNATGTSTIPIDTSIPQISEGTTFFGASITPKSATNVLKVDVVVPSMGCTVGAVLTISMFNTDVFTTDAVAVAAAQTAAGTRQEVVLTYYMVAGQTTTTTFNLNFGGNAAGTYHVNGYASAEFGASSFSTITITEYLP